MVQAESLFAERIEGNNCPQTLVLLRSGGTKSPLFLFQDGSGHALDRARLASKLSGNRPVYGLRWSNDGKESWPRLPDAVAHYVKEIQRVRPHGPYLLGGQRYGGLFAFEAGQQLRGKGETVQLVILMNTVFPNGWLQRLFEREPRFSRLLDPISFVAETYRATSYGGPMALISEGGLRNQLGWMSVSKGSLKVIELPENDIGSRPAPPAHVSELARTVDRLLEESSC